MHYYRIEYQLGEKKYLADYQACDIQTAMKQLSTRIKRKYHGQFSFMIIGFKRLD